MTRTRRIPNIYLVALAAAMLAAACTGDGAETRERPATTTTTTATPIATPEIVATPGSIGDPYSPALGNGGYDVSTYGITMDFNGETGRFDATAVIEAMALEDLDVFHLDLNGLRLDGVTVDGAPAATERDGSELIVTPAVKIKEGTPFVTEVDYGGTPGSHPSTMARYDVGWLTTPAGTHFVRAEPDGAHAWFPANDHPLDKAEFVIEVTVPDTLTAAASGTLGRRIRGVDVTTFRWTTDEVAPHSVTLVIGDLELWTDEAGSTRTGVQLRHLLPHEMAESPPRILRDLDVLFGFLEQRFGAFPYDSYGVAVVDGPTPFVPSNTWTILTKEQLEDGQVDVRLAADITRHWFGDSVSPAAWSEVWLSTSIPTYAGWLWVEARRGRRVADLVARTARSEVEDSSWPPPDEPPENNIYVNSVFIHGASYLHALRLKVGDSTFFDVLNTVYEENEGGHLTTADFVRTTNHVSGQGLSFFFEDWLHGDKLPGFPSR